MFFLILPPKGILKNVTDGTEQLEISPIESFTSARPNHATRTKQTPGRPREPRVYRRLPTRNRCTALLRQFSCFNSLNAGGSYGGHRPGAGLEWTRKRLESKLSFYSWKDENSKRLSEHEVNGRVEAKNASFLILKPAFFLWQEPGITFGHVHVPSRFDSERG